MISKFTWIDTYKLAMALSLATVATVTLHAQTIGDRLPDDWNNVAIGKAYTVSPNPNYTHSMDEGDTVQLTDGLYAGTTRLWTDLACVGWMHVGEGRVQITIDLGKSTPIRGASFNTGAESSSGGDWPAAIYLFASEDGEKYTYLGDLMELNRGEKPLADTPYKVQPFWTDRLNGRGQYLRLIVIPTGPFVFVDEIEISSRSDDEQTAANSDYTIDEPQEYVFSITLKDAVQQRLRMDLAELQNRIAHARITPTDKKMLLEEVSRLVEQTAEVQPISNPFEFKTIFPMNDLHASVLALAGKLAMLQKRPAFEVWTTNRYDFLAPTQRPDDRADSSLSIAAMKGETRHEALNLTNNTDKPQTIYLNVAELPEGMDTNNFTLDRVEWTDTRAIPSFKTKAWTQWQGSVGPLAVADALVPIIAKDGVYKVNVPAGMTRQVWWSVTVPGDVPAGQYEARIQVTDAERLSSDVPLSLHVYDMMFPDRPRLGLGGWAYTDTNSLYGLTPQNTTLVTEFLANNYVDSPWASSGTIPYGKYDRFGNMTDQPDTTAFDAWIDNWPDARRYYLFSWARGPIDGLERGTPEFNRAVGAYITFWVEHAASKGIAANDLYIVFVDEPRKHEDDQLTIDWAKPTRAAQPDLNIWTDPVYQDPTEALPGLWDAVDVIVPLRLFLNDGGIASHNFYREQAARGKQLQLYDCEGPVRRLDPYSYYRVMAWSCFDLGADSMFFWSFSGEGDAGSWNDYLNSPVSYAPQFLDAGSVYSSRHMMAIREGVQDYEYLALLRDRIQEMERVAPNDSRLADAQQSLKRAIKQVLNAPGAIGQANGKNNNWEVDRDRSVADQARRDVALALERLSTSSRD